MSGHSIKTSADSVETSAVRLRHSPTLGGEGVEEAPRVGLPRDLDEPSHDQRVLTAAVGGASVTGEVAVIRPLLEGDLRWTVDPDAMEDLHPCRRGQIEECETDLVSLCGLLDHDL